MMWQQIETADDVSELMWAASHFHDWMLMGFRYDSLARLKDGRSPSSPCPWDTNALILIMRFDTRDEDGNWPEIELEFAGVSKMNFIEMEVSGVHDCSLQKSKFGWVFSVEDMLTEEELEDPRSCHAQTFIWAETVRWRMRLVPGE